MTVEELLAREEIRHIMAVYNTAGDSLRIDEFTAVFTEDAELVTAHLEFRGREAIKNGLFGSVSESASESRRPTFVRHNLTTSKITLESDQAARGRTYFQVITDIGLDHAGIYLDEFRKEDQGWKIARRVVRTEYTADNSYFRRQ